MAFGHVCAVVGVLVAIGTVVASTGKAYYCRDPDTGKLHAVNSTWEAKSFCGNYTCKIRKRNLTDTGYASIRQINITNIPDHEKNYNETTAEKLDRNKTRATINLDNDEPQIGIIPVDGKTITLNTPKYYYEKPSKMDQVNDNRNKYEIENVHITGGVQQAITKYYQNKVTDGKKNDIQDIRKSKDDRYLTEREITAISEILHSVKRSELDAIVDIYNLAQEIYNEMDTATTTPTTDEETTNSNSIADDKSSKQEMKSYWYEPYYKGMHVDDHSTSKVVAAHSTAHPKKSFYSFFTGPAVSDEDFRRLPYHYHSPPITQESASYFPLPPTTVQTDFPKPCKKKHMNNFQIQNTPPSSYLLPYPFAYIHQYHLPTDYPKGLLYDIPYTWDYYNRVKKIPPYTGYIGDIAGTHINTQLQEMPLKQGQMSLEPVEPVPKPALEQKTMEHIKAVVQEQDLLRRLIMKTLNKEQDWQREHLSQRFLTNDVANLNNTHTRLRKSHPLTKKITLENVGRVLKLDDISRKKRSLKINNTLDPIQEEEGLYETFLETTTCQDQTVPGFFRVGNLTQAYPACCPQLIRTR